MQTRIKLAQVTGAGIPARDTWTPGADGIWTRAAVALSLRVEVVEVWDGAPRAVREVAEVAEGARLACTGERLRGRKGAAMARAVAPMVDGHRVARAEAREARQAAAVAEADAAEGAADVALVEAMARRFNRGRVRAGASSMWVAGAWVATMQDAMGDALLALVQWRNGQAVEGAEVTQGKDGRPVEPAKAIVWRALSASAQRDTWADTVGPAAAAAADWQAWQHLHGGGAGVVARDLVATWQAERLRGKRAGKVAFLGARLAAGRGRRAETAAKVQHAVTLILGGEAGEAAAVAAGFKAVASGGRQRMSAFDQLTRAARRMGARVLSLRARWAEDSGDEFKARRAPLDSAQAAAVAAAWAKSLAARPSGELPLPSGRESRRWRVVRRASVAVGRVELAKRRGKVRAEVERRRAVWEASQAKAAARRATLSRAAARAVARLGCVAPVEVMGGQVAGGLGCLKRLPRYLTR